VALELDLELEADVVGEGGPDGEGLNLDWFCASDVTVAASRRPVASIAARPTDKENRRMGRTSATKAGRFRH
jgi:hypothetical protein